MIAVWVILGVIGGLAIAAAASWFLYNPYFRMSVERAAQHKLQEQDDNTIYALRCVVEVIDFGSSVAPEMRYRWNIWQDGVERTHPLFLGNARFEDDAHEEAQLWIRSQQEKYEDTPLPVAL